MAVLVPSENTRTNNSNNNTINNNSSNNSSSSTIIIIHRGSNRFDQITHCQRKQKCFNFGTFVLSIWASILSSVRSLFFLLCFEHKNFCCHRGSNLPRNAPMMCAFEVGTKTLLLFSHPQVLFFSLRGTEAVWPDWAIYWTLGNFLKPLATINLPKFPTFLGNFCKGVKIFFLMISLLGNFYKHLAIFSGHTKRKPNWELPLVASFNHNPKELGKSKHNLKRGRDGKLKTNFFGGLSRTVFLLHQRPHLTSCSSEGFPHPRASRRPPESKGRVPDAAATATSAAATAGATTPAARTRCSTWPCPR